MATNQPPADATVTSLVDAADAGGPDADPETITTVSGHVTTDTQWASTIKIVGDTWIDPGVTVTVLSHATITVAAYATIYIDGTLAMTGTRTGKIAMRSAIAGDLWYGFVVSTTGKLTAQYLVSTDTGITMSGAANVELTDTQMSNVGHDLLVMEGGTLIVDHSWIGTAMGMPDSTHCDLHVEGGGPTISVTNSNISTAVYGMMFYTGVGAVFTHDNWFSNEIDVAEQAGPPVSGDLSGGWFAAGTPSAAGLTANNMSPTELTDTGPR